MPADRGVNGPHWNQKPDFQPAIDELAAMGRHDYVPANKAVFARFLCVKAVLPEMQAYEHCANGLLSVAEDIAERAYREGIKADTLVGLYLLGDLGDETIEPPSRRFSLGWSILTSVE